MPSMVWSLGLRGMSQDLAFLPKIYSQFCLRSCWSNGFLRIRSISIVERFLASMKVWVRKSTKMAKEKLRAMMAVKRYHTSFSIRFLVLIGLVYMFMNMHNPASRQPKNPYKRKFQKNLWFPNPTQFPTQGQWWSMRITHFLQTEQ